MLSNAAWDRILELLDRGDMSGRDLQNFLLKEGFMIKSDQGAPFYAMLAHMELAGLVEGWNEPGTEDGKMVTRQRFRRTNPTARNLANPPASFFERNGDD